MRKELEYHQNEKDKLKSEMKATSKRVKELKDKMSELEKPKKEEERKLRLKASQEARKVKNAEDRSKMVNIKFWFRGDCFTLTSIIPSRLGRFVSDWWSFWDFQPKPSSRCSTTMRTSTASMVLSA